MDLDTRGAQLAFLWGSNSGGLVGSSCENRNVHFSLIEQLLGGRYYSRYWGIQQQTERSPQHSLK